jgi:hypothetical protein
MSKTTREIIDHALAKGQCIVHHVKAYPTDPDGIFYPPTFAPAKGSDEGGHHIDNFGRPEDGKNLVTVNTAESSAHDQRDKIARFIPESVGIAKVLLKVTPKDAPPIEKTLPVESFSHRLGDVHVTTGTVDGASLAANPIGRAFEAVRLQNDYGQIMRISPLTVIFGTWLTAAKKQDVKIPKVVATEMRAFDCKPISKQTQHTPEIENILGNKEAVQEVCGVEDAASANLSSVPISAKRGVIVGQQGISRSASISINGIRNMGATDEKVAHQIHRAVLALSLLTLRPAQSECHLRRGCDLEFSDEGFDEVTITGVRRSESIKISLPSDEELAAIAKEELKALYKLIGAPKAILVETEATQLGNKQKERDAKKAKKKP